MTVLWSQPYFFLLLCTGLYYTLRSFLVLSEIPDHNPYEAFLRQQCSPETRRQVLASLLRSIPGSISTLSWWMLLGMLELGGAGCLFWYAVFSLLWIRPLGALSTLWAYYRAPDEAGVRFSRLFARSRARKGLPPAPRRTGLLKLLQLGALCCFLCPAGPVLSRSLSYLSPRTALLLLLAAAASRLLLPPERRRAWSAISLLFLALLGTALVYNLPNLIPVLQLVLQDAFQCSSFLFALSGAGAQLVLRSGGQLGVGALAFLVTAGPTGGAPELPHPVCCGLLAQLQALVSLLLHLLLGLLFLCTQLVPQESAWILAPLWGLLCLFGVDRFVRVFRLLPVDSWWRGLAAALCCLLAWQNAGAFQALFWGLMWAGSLGMVWLLLSDSGWYFALLEDYRDAFLWHVQPHPRISRRYRPPPP